MYIKVFNKALNDKRVARIALPGISGSNVTYTRQISRIVTPVIDSYILAQFFSHIANTYSFRQICFQIEGKIIYKLFQNALVNYTEKDPLLSGDQVLGLEVSVHGRIPREAVRPRKTVQVKVFGRRSKRLINKNTFLKNRAEIVNPELGTFSV